MGFSIVGKLAIAALKIRMFWLMLAALIVLRPLAVMGWLMLMKPATTGWPIRMR
jgi:hypothetical protein